MEYRSSAYLNLKKRIERIYCGHINSWLTLFMAQNLKKRIERVEYYVGCIQFHGPS